MSMSNKKLPFSGNAVLLEKIAINFDKFVEVGAQEIPREQIYNVVCEEESPVIDRKARIAALNELKGFTKLAFDTRRTNQETDRNPRINLQNWHRTDQFIDEEDQKNIEILGKLLVPLNELKESFEREPGWHESYSRQLLDQVDRALRVKVGDQGIHRAQFIYLDQLMFQRYRLSFEEISRMDKTALKNRILDKDEDLLKRGAFLHASALDEELNKKSSQQMSVKTGDNVQTTQEALIKAIFGGDTSGKKGSKTITITIKNDFEE
jgi:hypothetical protein